MTEAVVLSQVTGSAEIDWVLLVAGLVGGLAIFLLGMDRMTESLRLIAGDRMREILGKLTKNRFVGALTGSGVTAVLQSSSVTTVLVVGFISSGLMAFEQSVSIIVGANIGTTVTAQIIAFEITTIALFAVAIGFGFSFFARRPERQAQGTALMGLGLLFFGMSLMGDAMSPLRTSEGFIDAMAALENPLLGIAAGAVFTGLVQSSSATTGIVIVLAQQGLIPLEAGIALVLGANVGTSITAVLASIGKPREARRAAVAHTMFNVGGVVIWLPFIGFLSSMVDGVGGAQARQIANAHTIFNVANAAVALAVLPYFSRLVQRLVADRPQDAEAMLRARYLDRSLLRTPSLALDSARLEWLRMASRVQAMVTAALPAVLTESRWQVLGLERMDDEVDDLHGQIIGYLGEISTQRLSENSTEELIDLMQATNDLEAIGDIIETNMTALGFSRVE
ncbi:MAG: Na/Pi cotransporter family protein, partial [Acidimicrobiia bacterium]|nr:Na/Pi cotransporter family protein [Acidimicrobiia bacterium]